MNTEITYLYRDAGNYKVHNRVVIEGEVSVSQVEQITDALFEGELFIPSMVGLPEKRFEDFDPNLDHPWFELYSCGITITTHAPTIPISITELVDRFEKATQVQWNQA